VKQGFELENLSIPRAILKTRQTEWTSKDGGPDATKQLRRDAPPFVVTTEPAQLRSYGFPKEVQANFEQAGFKIDDCAFRPS
jgi:hypothetical protein